jgi:single-strand DNA-binding protein
MNCVVMVGRLTRDPELRFVAGSGKAVATFSIAVDRRFSKEKVSDFFNIVVWGKPAETAANYLAKGRKVAIQGSLQSRSYEDKTGQKRYVTEIVAENVEFLEWGDRKERSESDSSLTGFGDDFSADGFHALEDDDDIPF